ncbi:putative signal peptide protein [Puccinia sorghi]|uniref:Putative signal peptide protein n=1 Tax=Puccinia sorghi TaxID=27349 RepID=A0A0L6UZQ9_9BASI|nr:putative signal peptide protein [Puccinia sorghi]
MILMFFSSACWLFWIRKTVWMGEGGAHGGGRCLVGMLCSDMMTLTADSFHLILGSGQYFSIGSQAIVKDWDKLGVMTRHPKQGVDVITLHCPKYWLYQYMTIQICQTDPKLHPALTSKTRSARFLFLNHYCYRFGLCLFFVIVTIKKKKSIFLLPSRMVVAAALSGNKISRARLEPLQVPEASSATTSHSFFCFFYTLSRPISLELSGHSMTLQHIQETVGGSKNICKICEQKNPDTAGSTPSKTEAAKPARFEQVVQFDCSKKPCGSTLSQVLCAFSARFSNPTVSLPSRNFESSTAVESISSILFDNDRSSTCPETFLSCPNICCTMRDELDESSEEELFLIESGNENEIQQESKKPRIHARNMRVFPNTCSHHGSAGISLPPDLPASAYYQEASSSGRHNISASQYGSSLPLFIIITIFTSYNYYYP